MERDQAYDNSTAVQDVPTNKSKRSLSPDDQPPRKRKRLSEVDEASTGLEDDGTRVRGVKRMILVVGERPGKQDRNRSAFLRLVLDKERPSSSVDAAEGTSSRKLGSRTKQQADKRKRNNKRKAEDDEDPPRKKRKTESEEDTPKTLRAKLEAKYEEQGPLGEGGCGSVFAGYRKSDHLPVAIKHIEKDKVFCKHEQKDGRQVPAEVAVMLKLKAGGSGSAGHSSPVSLLDWYDLDQELILVLERPVPAVDLLDYMEENNNRPLDEDEAKIILKQLVDAAVHLHLKRIFHRDIKVENILIETGSNVPRVRLMDFGLSCFSTKGSTYTIFYGTSAHVPPEWLSRGFYTAGPTTVWQLGVVLFETLHQEGFTSTEFLRDQLRISCDVSEDCKDFLEKCLAEDPQNRPSLQELQRHPWLT